MQTPRPLTKPTRQRKMLYSAPAHIRHKLLAAHLSQSLRASHDVRSLAVRTGDTVRVVRGDHRGVEGKITRVDLAKYRIYVEGLTREKVDGTTVFVPIHPSKVIITHLNLDDEWRKKVLENKKERHEKLEKAAEQLERRPVEKPEEVAEVKEAAEEKPVSRKKAPVEKVKKAKRKAPAKKAAEEAELKAEETKKEEKPKAKRRTRRTTRRTAKKTEQEGR